MAKTQPYIYIIQWANVNKGYIGVRYANGCSPDDLLNTYFTSSKYVKKLIQQVGLPDKIKIYTYPDRETAVIFESKFQKRLGVLKSDYWLNKNISGKFFHRNNSGDNNPFYGRQHNEQTKRTISEKHKGKIVTQETRIKMSESKKSFVKEKNSFYGRQHNEQTKRTISEKHKGKIVTQETRERISNSLKGKPRSEETKKKISDSNSGKNHFTYDPTIYCFYNSKTNDQFIGNKYELIEQYGLNGGSLKGLISKRIPSLKGWTIKGIYNGV